MKIRIEKILLVNVILLLLGCDNNDTVLEPKSNLENSNSLITIDQTVDCMDKNGTPYRYQIQYNSVELSNAKIGKVKNVIKSIVRDKVETFHFVDDCLMKKDSIENIIINDIRENGKAKEARVDSITIKMQIPFKIKEHMLTRYIEVNDIDSY